MCVNIHNIHRVNARHMEEIYYYQSYVLLVVTRITTSTSKYY